jgi:hypothetical protein
MRNNHLKAYQNEIAILGVLHRFGHARHADIARAVWPGSAAISAKNIASRTLNRLVDRRQIRRVLNPFMGYSFKLRMAGANRVGSEIDGSEPGRTQTPSITGPRFYHHTLGTRYMIEKEITGLTAYGESAIYRGVEGFSHELFSKQFKKIPDGIVLAPGATRGIDPDITALDWIEVENYYKPPDELRRIIELSGKIGTWIDSDRKIMLDRVVFVYSVMNAHEKSLYKGIERYLLEQNITDPHTLSGIVLASCDVKPPFGWLGYMELSWLRLRELGLVKVPVELSGAA